MKKLLLAGVLGLAACNQTAGNDQAAAPDNGVTAAGEPVSEPTTGTESASAAFPRGARIVEEDGTVWRIDADGARVRLGPNDSRIVVENGVRYRVDPGGTRVRIDPQGAVIDVDLPDVDVGINAKGNPDVDVNTNRR